MIIYTGVINRVGDDEPDGDEFAMFVAGNFLGLLGGLVEGIIPIRFTTPKTDYLFCKLRVLARGTIIPRRGDEG